MSIRTKASAYLEPVLEPRQLIEFAQWNKVFITKKCEAEQHALDKLQAEFKDRALLAITKQNMPADAEIVATKADRIALFFVDPLTIESRIQGLYYGANALAPIKLTYDPYVRKKISYHELAHGISGHEVHVMKNVVETGAGTEQRSVNVRNGGPAHSTRIGFAIYGTNKAREVQELYVSLNEASTDQVAEILQLDPTEIIFVPPGNPDNVSDADLVEQDPMHVKFLSVGMYQSSKRLARLAEKLCGLTFYDVLAGYFEDSFPGILPVKQNKVSDALSTLDPDLLQQMRQIENEQEALELSQSIKDGILMAVWAAVTGQPASDRVFSV